MDIDCVREDFPILKKGIIYLDSAATSLTPEVVIDAEMNFYHNFNANIARGVYEFSSIATEKYDQAHNKVARFLGVEKQEIIFTKNTTDGINSLAFALPWKEGDEIITTLIEHHSNFLPWLKVSEIFGVKVIKIKPNEEGIFNLKDFENAIDRHTKLIAVNHVSNVLGTINDIKGIVEIARKKGVPVLADGAQAAPHLPVNLKELGVDFYASSGHKMLGPTGTGILYIDKKWFDKLKPALIGGGTIKDVDIDSYILDHPYERFEPGTPNIAGGIALGEAADYLMKIGMENVMNHENELSIKTIEGLKSIGVTVFGPKDYNKRIGVVSFEIEGLTPHKAAFLLSDMFNIAVRSGHHCAYNILKHIINRPLGTCRASFYIYNTEEEINMFLDAVNEIKGMV